MIIETSRVRSSAPALGPTFPQSRPCSPVEPSPRPAGPSRARATGLTIACGLYLASILAVWIAMRFMGDRSWIGTLLLLAPRWPYAAPLALLWPWAVLKRRWRHASAVAGASLLILVPVMGFRIAMPGGSGRGDLRLLTCNIHRQHLDGPKLAAYISEVRPDVVAIQGWSEMHRETLFADGNWQVRTVGELLVASHTAVGEPTVLALENDPGAQPGERGAAAVFEVQTARGPVHIACLHLASPHAGLVSMWTDRGAALAANLDRRWRESRQLRDTADAVHGPLLLAGDFNTTTDSPIFGEQWTGFTDAFVSRGLGLGYTYLNAHTQFRIDHILADASWDIARCWVGPDVNAAHRPLVADVNFR